MDESIFQPSKSALMPLQQHPNFARALRRFGTHCRIVPLEDRAHALVIRRAGIKFASRGPVWTKPTSKLQQMELLRRSNLHLINGDGLAHEVLSGAGFLRLMTAAHVAELRICGTTEEQLLNAQQKWRNRARKASQEGFSFSTRAFDPVADAWLLEADFKQQRAKKYRALPHGILRAYWETAPQDIQLVAATIGQDTIAAMLFLRHGPVATYHIGWSSSRGRDVSAHHALLIHATQTLNVQRIDLGTVDTEESPGLARFKIGSGAVVRSLSGTWGRLPLPSR